MSPCVVVPIIALIILLSGVRSGLFNQNNRGAVTRAPESAATPGWPHNHRSPVHRPSWTSGHRRVAGKRYRGAELHSAAKDCAAFHPRTTRPVSPKVGTAQPFLGSPTSTSCEGEPEPSPRRFGQDDPNGRSALARSWWKRRSMPITHWTGDRNRSAALLPFKILDSIMHRPGCRR